MRGRLILLAALLAGCGTSQYEQRLNDTQTLYRHIELLDDNLAAKWSDSGIELRVPKQFRVLPPPKPAKSKPGEPEEPVFDDRLPSYNLALPGLRGAWVADVPVRVDEKTEKRPARLYLLSNHDLAGGKPEEVSKFHVNAAAQIAESLGVTIAPTDWVDEKFPRRATAFVEQVPFKSTELRRPDKEPLVFDNVPLRFTLYLHQKGDVLVVLVSIIPEGIDSRERLHEKQDLAFETLRITNDRLPRAPATKPGDKTKTAPTGTGVAF